MKNLMRAIQLVISDAERHPELEVDEAMLAKVSEAKSLVATMRGTQVIEGVLALRKNGIGFTVSMEPSVRILSDTPPQKANARYSPAKPSLAG